MINLHINKSKIEHPFALPLNIIPNLVSQPSYPLEDPLRFHLIFSWFFLLLCLNPFFPYDKSETNA